MFALHLNQQMTSQSMYICDVVTTKAKTLGLAILYTDRAISATALLDSIEYTLISTTFPIAWMGVSTCYVCMMWDNVVPLSCRVNGQQQASNNTQMFKNHSIAPLDNRYYQQHNTQQNTCRITYSINDDQ